LDESIQAVRPIADRKKIAIHIDAPSELPKVNGEKYGLMQVFVNLINNAVKFSPNGSAVKVSVGLENETVTLAIQDQGLGIPAEDIEHLFERFFRARNVTVAEIPGSGVGLYIVKSIVEELGGSIGVESREGSGTTFLVNLELSQ
jgi:signal transduction histidine kinase